ncbi:MAG: ABC transporter permease [Succinivibrionaceae bacterium]|nr:ABC transporter permease [Succinivibrionaceae bacterium]
MSKALQIAVLSYKDVLHEWRMTLCVMFAVAAIATPLLLFFGLKSGVMDTLERRLLENPVTMELSSVNEKKLEPSWFEETASDPRVEFVIPRTRRLSASAEFFVKDKERKIRRSLDLYPTGDGDPLLLHFGSAAPGEGECVLTAEASRRLEAKEGDVLVATVSKDRGSVKAQREFRVAGILPDGAGATPVAYIRLKSLEQVEAFKDGVAVPELNWPGSDNVTKSVTPSVLLALDKPLDAVRESMLIQNTGFVNLKGFEPSCSDGEVHQEQDLDKQKPYHPFIPCEKYLYQISSVGMPADISDVKSLADRVRGRQDALLVPYNPYLSVTAGNRTFSILSFAAYGKSMVSGENCADSNCDLAAKLPPRVFYVSPAVAAEMGDGPKTVTVTYHEVNSRGEVTDRSISFEAAFVGKEGVGPNVALAHIALAGQLGSLQNRELSDAVTSAGEKAFMLKRRGYIGFRMYAAKLEDVMSLQEKLTAEGIRTMSKADRIAEVMSLDKYLGMLFWLIASASLAGAVCCLVANMYASIERKRKELAILRLLGVHGSTLCIYPLCSSLLLTLGGIAISLAVFFVLAYTVNSTFAEQLQGDEKFCNLTMLHLAVTVLIAALIACVSGLAASRRVMKIEPSESLRDE